MHAKLGRSLFPSGAEAAGKCSKDTCCFPPRQCLDRRSGNPQFGRRNRPNYDHVGSKAELWPNFGRIWRPTSESESTHVPGDVHYLWSMLVSSNPRSGRHMTKPEPHERRQRERETRAQRRKRGGGRSPMRPQDRLRRPKEKGPGSSQLPEAHSQLLQAHRHTHLLVQAALAAQPG